jgi:hypothetical protein
VSEFERVRSAVPPFTPPARPEAFLPDDVAEAVAFEAPFQREGLPPGFRMRHDAHYVDQLTARTVTAPQVRLIPLRDIDAERPAEPLDLDALARSIGRLGVLQPLLVRPRAGRFELVAGTRRLAAAALAGLTEVPCLVHQVDDARAKALHEADNLRAAAPAETAAPLPAELSPAGLTELSQSVGAIGSCLHLLADRETVLRDRVALDLLRTEVHRAARLVKCLTVLGQDPAFNEADVSLSTVLEQAVEGFAAERRLSGATIGVETGDGPFAIRADADWLLAGLAAALGGMLAMVHGTRTPALSVRASSSGSRASLMVEISQQSVTVPAWALTRFFDQAWTDRPGGFQAAAELAATRKIAQLHRGGAEVLPGERGGCRLLLLFPSA